MPGIPLHVLGEILADPKYKECARRDDGGCDGRVTFEHALLHAGRQVQEKFAIVPLCMKHHGVGIWQDKGSLDKRKNEWLALCQATDEELEKYSKVVNLKAKRDYLTSIYERK